jgi:predicted RNA-binding Zn ribbon-like protein
VQVTSATKSDIRAMLEIAAGLANQVLDDEPEFRPFMIASGVTRASTVSDDDNARLWPAVAALVPLLDQLADPDTTTEQAIELVNERLGDLELSPSIASHGHFGPHLHWNRPGTAFEDQIVVDVLMAAAHEVCLNGAARFGRCGAESCQHLFYDGTRNRSRRFCDDSRCASRTHTADHRARQRAAS